MDPGWAVPYSAAAAYEAGEGWREHYGRAARGMSEDPLLSWPGWDKVWWTQLRHPSPAGADHDRWFAVHRDPLPQTDIRPCCRFSGWGYEDAHGHHVVGAPLRIAVYPGLWRDGDMLWSMGCHWAPYTEWSQPHSLERVWRSAVGGSFRDPFGPWSGDEEAVERKADQLRTSCGFTHRSAMLRFVTESGYPNDLCRDLAGHGGNLTEQIRAGVILRAAEALCWERAVDDLPWPEFAPAAIPQREPGSGPAPKPEPEGPRAVPLSLFGPGEGAR